jgi:hypothetical protein
MMMMMIIIIIIILEDFEMYRPYDGNTMDVESKKKKVLPATRGATGTNSVSFIQYPSNALGKHDTKQPHWALHLQGYVACDLHTLELR